MNAPQGPPGMDRVTILELLLVGLIGVAVAGFLVGVREAPSPLVAPAQAAVDGAAPPRADGVRPAMPYREMPKLRDDRRAASISEVASLRDGLAEIRPPDVAPSASARADANLERSARRAYDGAPPTIPHAVDERGAGGCLACHGEGAVIDGRIAARISHTTYTQCTQCHVTSNDRGLPPVEVGRSTFRGLAAGSGRMERAWDGAPPPTPHPTWMRENCASCHGPTGEPALQTTHPERQNCTQCHAPSAELDQAPGSRRSLVVLPSPSTR